MTLWMGLLGFRSHLDKDNWSLHSEATRLGLRRITALHESALLSMNDRYEIVQLNDAVVMSQDIPPNGTGQAVGEFLALVDRSFELAAVTDQSIGGYGVRGVVARGLRYNLRGNLGWISKDADPKRPSYFCPRPIMMNTAFGRAYGVESSHELRKVSSLYVERSCVFDYGAAIMENWDIQQVIEVPQFGYFLLVREEEF